MFDGWTVRSNPFLRWPQAGRRKSVARAIDQAVNGRDGGPILRKHLGCPDGPARRDPPAETAGRDRRDPDAEDAPAQLRHTLVTTMRYDRARKTLDRHPNYILAAYMASGT